MDWVLPWVMVLPTVVLVTKWFQVIQLHPGELIRDGSITKSSRCGGVVDWRD